MSRVGTPAPFGLVASYFGVALASWAAATVVLVVVAPDVAAAGLAAPNVLLAVHLVALGFLPPAVTGAALHILPTLLRNSASRTRGWAALPLLCFGPLLAVGIAHDVATLIWVSACAETLGFAIIAWELVALAMRAPRGRMLLASRAGIVLSTLHAAAALAFGAGLAAREWRPLFGIPHDRAVAIHLHLAVLGWLTLLILAVGRTLGPMLALAPAAGRRRLPAEELVLTAGVWLLAAGFALGSRPLELTGALVSLAAVASFAALMARVARQHRLAGLEGPIAHLLTGLCFLTQAAVLGIGMLTWLDATPRRLTAYVVLLLVGWAGGVTLGHLGKLLSLSAWAWWPPGPRPKQSAFYPRRMWIAEAVLFAVGVEAVAVGALRGSEWAVRGGAILLVAGAVAALAGAARTMASARG
ncbi:MAG TPA: hypothetical protein VIJ70_11750 [Gaiellaceae bacterium]